MWPEKGCKNPKPGIEIRKAAGCSFESRYVPQDVLPGVLGCRKTMIRLHEMQLGIFPAAWTMFQDAAYYLVKKGNT